MSLFLVPRNASLFGRDQITDKRAFVCYVRGCARYDQSIWQLTDYTNHMAEAHRMQVVKHCCLLPIENNAGNGLFKLVGDGSFRFLDLPTEIQEMVLKYCLLADVQPFEKLKATLHPGDWKALFPVRPRRLYRQAIDGPRSTGHPNNDEFGSQTLLGAASADHYKPYSNVSRYPIPAVWQVNRQFRRLATSTYAEQTMLLDVEDPLNFEEWLKIQDCELIHGIRRLQFVTNTGPAYLRRTAAALCIDTTFEVELSDNYTRITVKSAFKNTMKQLASGGSVVEAGCAFIEQKIRKLVDGAKSRGRKLDGWDIICLVRDAALAKPSSAFDFMPVLDWKSMEPAFRIPEAPHYRVKKLGIVIAEGSVVEGSSAV